MRRYCGTELGLTNDAKALVLCKPQVCKLQDEPSQSSGCRALSSE